MRPTPGRFGIASALIAIASAVAAQTASAVAPPPPAENHRPASQPERARFEARALERHTQHMAALKTRLQLDAAQEGAWNAFAAAMKPPAAPPPGSAPFWAGETGDKLTTPERIDRMQAMQTERAARMKQRADAIKAFYTQLNPQQRAVFDLEHARMAQKATHPARHMKPGNAASAAGQSLRHHHGNGQRHGLKAGR